MKYLILAGTLLLGTAYAATSMTINSYKSTLSVNKIELGDSSKESLFSTYPFSYKGIKYYVPMKTPSEFNKVVSTVYKGTCVNNTFEYGILVNKPLWESIEIREKVKSDFRKYGFNLTKSFYGVYLWKSKNTSIVSFMTKVTPFTYVNSVCEVTNNAVHNN